MPKTIHSFAAKKQQRLSMTPKLPPRPLCSSCDPADLAHDYKAENFIENMGAGRSAGTGVRGPKALFWNSPSGIVCQVARISMSALEDSNHRGAMVQHAHCDFLPSHLRLFCLALAKLSVPACFQSFFGLPVGCSEASLKIVTSSGRLVAISR